MWISRRQSFKALPFWVIVLILKTGGVAATNRTRAVRRADAIAGVTVAAGGYSIVEAYLTNKES